MKAHNGSVPVRQLATAAEVGMGLVASRRCFFKGPTWLERKNSTTILTNDGMIYGNITNSGIVNRQQL